MRALSVRAPWAEMIASGNVRNNATDGLGDEEAEK